MFNKKEYINTLPTERMQEWTLNKYFFSKEERRFFHELCKYIKSIGKYVTINSKVRIADLVHEKHKLNKSDYYKIFGRTSTRHIDYVITDYAGHILCLIELDGESHKNISTQKSDAFKDTFFDTIGLHLERFQNKTKHDFHRLDKYLEKSPN